MSLFERRLEADLERRFPSWAPIRALRSVSGGFSGSPVYRVLSGAGEFAVKLSPYDRERFALAAARIQAIETVRAVDPELFPRIARDATGAAVWPAEIDGERWQGEASEWLIDSRPAAEGPLMPEAAGRAAVAESASSAFRLLVRFHTAAGNARFASETEDALRWPNVLPQRYLNEWQTVLTRGMEGVRRGLPRLEPPLSRMAAEYLDRLPSRASRAAAAFVSLSNPLPGLRPCLRDVHRRNIHFRGGEAVSFYDWDALRYDRRIGDFARLAASYRLPAAEAERHIESACAEVSGAETLSPWERSALGPAISTQVWIPPLRWLTWVLVEGREFADPAAARERLRETLESALTEPCGADET